VSSAGQRAGGRAEGASHCCACGLCQGQPGIKLDAASSLLLAPADPHHPCFLQGCD
jgi:hypothetical protein